MRKVLLTVCILGGVMPALLAQSTQTGQASPAVPPASPSAQTPTPSPAPGAVTAPATSFSDTVVVTSSLDTAPRDETPAATSVITGQEIQERQARTLADLIWSVPGVTVATAGAPGQQTSVFIRGANSNQTLLLWNGIPLNDPLLGGVNWQFVPLEGADRVEVVRGPFSALYGSEAMGGVVQVITGSRQGGMVNLEGGQGGYLQGLTAVGANLGGGVHLDVIGHAQRSDGTLNNDFFDGEEGVARLLWTFEPGADVGLLLRANDSRTGVPFSSGVATPDSTISWQEREAAVPLNLTGSRWLFDGQISDTRFSSDFHSPDDPFGAFDSSTRSQAVDGRAVGSYHLLNEPSQNLEVSVGTEYQHLEVTYLDTSPTDLDGIHQRTWAGFGEARYGTGPLHLDVGVRRDDNDVYGGQTSLRAGGVLRLAKETLLRASYGQAFRAPTLGDLYFPFSGNPDLRPETSTSYELGIEQGLGPWRFVATGFDNHQRNLILFDNFTFQEINVGKARSRGVEGAVTYRQGIVAAELNGTRLDAIDEDTGLELLRRPKWSSNLVLSVRPADWTFNLTGRYVGERADLDPVTGAPATDPGYLRLDLAARWQVLRRVAPFARVENLADRRYSDVLGYPAPGRTFIGGVALDL
jgi:vitamin B12 transporter